MKVLVLAAVPTIALFGAALPAQAASFDCSKAQTPLEHAICEGTELSRADDIIAKAFATALGGLGEESSTALRADQRNWLDYVQMACTDDAKPITSGRYDEEGRACLVGLFNARIDALAQSRMISRHRFSIETAYGVLQDPNEVGNDNSYWKLATHELAVPQLDSDDPLADKFNAFVQKQAGSLSDLSLNGKDKGLDVTSDTDAEVSVKEIAADTRITLEAVTYWYGHGAAHGQSNISYIHYLIGEDRALEASDIFTGEGWENALRDAAWAQLQAEHKDGLIIETADDIAELVTDPTRWDLSDPYGLILQFNPYEVSAYAYGSPTVSVSWETMSTFQAEHQETFRYGQ